MVRITDSNVQDFEKKHIAAVRDMAAECAVLLKSNGDFPLASAGKIALFGNGARNTIKGGTGSGDVNVRHFVSVEEGLENAGFEITSKAWLDTYTSMLAEEKAKFLQGLKAEAKAAGVNAIWYCMGKVMPEPAYNIPLEGEAETAVYVLARNSGEGADRTPVAGDINLTETEQRDILALNEKYDKFILVLNVGGMVDLSPVSAVKNILLLSQLGTPIGDVLADILLGKSYPSGKLTTTWAPIASYPSTEGFGDPNDTYYKEGIYVGYRYFDTVNETPVYPFGYGLGYTTFEVKGKSVAADEKQVTVTASVKNTGNFAGKEVVQVYVSAPAGKLDKPYQELKGFAKTKELAPGEETEVTVTFDTASMASFSEEASAYVLEAGKYIIRVGNCSRDTHVCGIVSLDQDAVTEKVKHICPGWGFEDMKPEGATYSYEGEAEEIAAALIIELDASRIETRVALYSEVMPEREKTEPFDFAKVVSRDKTLDEFVAGLTDEQLAYLCIGHYKESDGDPLSAIGAAAYQVAGAAGETSSRLKDLGVPGLVMADGPAGLRLSPMYKWVNGEAKSSGGFDNFIELMDENELKMMASMMPQPSEEEQKAPYNYQYCIAIPIGTALAQAWNPEACQTCGDIVGEEMEMFGVHMWLAPAMNIHRSPLCGRDFEYYSEDPLVSGCAAAAITKGVQAHKGCATTIKHFCCNNQETNRFLSNSVVSERAMREIYLKGFEICVKTSQPHALMSSYNLVNGEHTCNTKDIQTCALRDEWGYEGVVMTDWLVTRSMGDSMSGTENTNKYSKASAAGCVKAGNDITMPGGEEDFADIMDALSNPQHPYALTRAELQTCAKRVLGSVLKLA